MSSDLLSAAEAPRRLFESAVADGGRNPAARRPPYRGVLLTVPTGSERKALAWAAGHRDWIEAQLERVVPPEPLIPGGSLPLYGLPHEIDWDSGRPRTPSLEAGRLLVGGPADTVEARILRWLRRHAADLLGRETAEFAAKAGVKVDRVGIGDPVRVGRC